MRIPILTALALLPLTACSGGGHDHDHDHEGDHGHAHAAADPAVPSADAVEHAVICGCELEAVGHCSEWIDVDGEWVALELPMDLGSMPFCRKDGLIARVDGEVVEGTFQASTFALVAQAGDAQGDLSPDVRDHVLFFTDLHFWEVVWNPLRLLNKRLLGNANVALKRRHHFPMANARPFAELALASGARDVIIGGDVTSTSTEKEFRLARAFVDDLVERGARVEIVPGNHDVYTFGAARRRTFERWFESLAPEGGYPARRVLRGGTPVILYSSVRPNRIASSGAITDGMREGVERLLAEGADGPTLVVGHYPLLDRTTAYTSNASRHCEGADEFRAMLGRSGKRVLHVSGHVHRFSSVADPELPNLHHLTGPSFFNHWSKADREGGYLELECLESDFRVHHHFKSSAGWDRETFEPGQSPHAVLTS